MGVILMGVSEFGLYNLTTCRRSHKKTAGLLGSTATKTETETSNFERKTQHVNGKSTVIG